jgi:penicillin-binding protein 1A
MSSRRGRLARLAAAAMCVIALPVLAVAFAWAETPGVSDLSRRVAQREAAGTAHPIALAAVAPIVVEALIATEDERYRSNSGIDVIGLMRALPYDVTHLSLAQGGSTLTEQLAKNLWLRGNDGNAWSKLKDMALALKLDRRYSKDAILATYLGTAYFGQGAYGIGDASHRYFGVAPGALSIAEASMLVGLVQAPTSYDPYVHPAAARQRQVSVLRSLVRVGALSAPRATRVLAEPVRLADGRVVPGVRGVDLASGAAFAWAGLVLALLAVLAGVIAYAARRLVRTPVASRVAAILAAGLFVIALIEAVRSVRVL